MKEKIRKLKERLTENGQEKLDPTPMEPPIGFRRQPTIAEQIREMVRSERLAADLRAKGVETFEEADDFEIADDEPDPQSRWENEYEPSVSELRKREKQAIQAREAAEAAARSGEPGRVEKEPRSKPQAGEEQPETQ